MLRCVERGGPREAELNVRCLDGPTDRGHMAEVGRFRPFAGSSTNDCMGSKAATRSCGGECPLQRPPRPKPASLLPASTCHLGLLRAHLGRSRAPRRHSNADIRPSVVVAARISAVGGKRTFPSGPRLSCRPLGHERCHGTRTEFGTGLFRPERNDATGHSGTPDRRRPS
jgi:hypothetical protein